MSIWDSEPQLIRDNSLGSAPTTNLECDDVRMPFLGSDLENGGEPVSVLDSTPASSVGELPQHHHTVRCQHQVAEGGGGTECSVAMLCANTHMK